MSWTTPRTWVSGETVTAAELNTHVRDNLNYLYARPTMQARLHTAAQSIPNTTPTTLICETVDYDTYTGYNVSTGKYTVPAGQGGVWFVTLFVSFASNGTGVRQLFLQPTAVAQSVSASVDALGRLTMTQIYNVAAGTDLYGQVAQTSGGALNIPADGAFFTCGRL